MIQDHLRSAIFRSLTNPPTNEKEGQPVSCKTHAYSKTKHTHDHPIDLEDSLAMLSRLEEASRRMYRSKQRHSVDGSSRRMNMLQLNERVYSSRHGFQEHRHSFDGSMRPDELKRMSRLASRDSVEELRRVIKGSLCRQNLLPRSPENDEACIKQSFERFRGPNLVAKLMGLDEAPQLMEKKKADDQTQRSLEEIIESMHFKGLLKSSHVENHMRDESPPIVIMKPLYLPQWERAEAQKSNHERMLRKTFDQKQAARIEKAKVQPRKDDSKTGKKAGDGRKLVLDLTMEEDIIKPVKAKRIVTTKTSPAQPERRHSTTKNKVFPVKPESKNSAYSLKEKTIPRAKPSRKSTDAKIYDKNCEYVKETISVNETDIHFRRERLHANRIPQKIKMDAKTCKKADTRESQERAMPNNSQVVKTTELAQEVTSLSDTKPATKEVVVGGDDLMRLLLGSRSFLTRAKELYGMDARHQPIHRQRKGIDEDVMRNARIYLDCGNELMSRKIHQRELMIYPTLRTQMWDPTASLTLYQLAEEISSRIRVMACYNKVDTNITSDDVLYVRLGRDLRCKEISVNAMWDVGWLTWGYPEEAVQLACEMGESIMASLIAEVAMDLV